MPTPEPAEPAGAKPARRTGGVARIAPAAPVALWRIASDTPGWGADDLGGLGAQRSGGRWNRPGVALVYASTSRALACLETVVHLAAQPLPLNRVLVRIDLPRRAWDDAVRAEPDALVGWDAQPAGLVSLDWGGRWAASGASLAAIVPSAIVPEESNVLINPAHAQAAGLVAVRVRRWLYDPRLGGAGA